MSFKQWMTLMSEHTNDLVPDIISLEVLRRVFINSKMDFLQVDGRRGWVDVESGSTVE